MNSDHLHLADVSTESFAAQVLADFICDRLNEATDDHEYDWLLENLMERFADHDATEALFGDATTWSEGVPFVVRVGDGIAAGFAHPDPDQAGSYPLGLDVALVKDWRRRYSHLWEGVA